MASSKDADQTDLSNYLDDPTNQLETLLSSSFAQHTGSAYLGPQDFLNHLERSQYALPPVPSSAPPPASIPAVVPTFANEAVELSDDARLAQLEQLSNIVDSAMATNQDFQTQSSRLLKQLHATMERCGDLHYLTQDLCEETGETTNIDIIADDLEQPTLPWFKHYHLGDLPPSKESEQLHRYMADTRPLPWTKDEITTLKRNFNTDIGRATHQYEQQYIYLIHLKYLIDRNGHQPDWTLQEEAEAIDWVNIQSMSQELRTHTPTECRLRWLNVESPRLNTSAWDKAEIDRLYTIVTQHNGRDWVSIAKTLATNRTPVACLKQYRKKPLDKKEWTKDEDDRLREAISMFGSNWQSVARQVGRTSNQCINRWTKTLKPGIKRGRWTEDEDDALKKAVEACGTVWKKIALRVKGRTDQQCRERWVNVLDPRIIKTKHWSAEEDATILRLADGEVGHQWSTISKAMGYTRTDNAILRRYEDLCKKQGRPVIKKTRRVASELTKANKAAAQAGAVKRPRKTKKQQLEELEEDQLENDNVQPQNGLADTNIDPALHENLNSTLLPLLNSQIVNLQPDFETLAEPVIEPPPKRQKRNNISKKALVEPLLEGEEVEMEDVEAKPAPKKTTRSGRHSRSTRAQS